MAKYFENNTQQLFEQLIGALENREVVKDNKELVEEYLKLFEGYPHSEDVKHDGRQND